VVASAELEPPVVLHAADLHSLTRVALDQALDERLSAIDRERADTLVGPVVTAPWYEGRPFEAKRAQAGIERHFALLRFDQGAEDEEPAPR
jgi:hypothetical protein